MSKLNKFLFIILTISLLSGCGKGSDDLTSQNTLSVNGVCKPVINQCEIVGENIRIKLQFKATPSYQRLLPTVVETPNTLIQNISITMIIDGKEMPALEMKKSAVNQWETALMTFAKVTKDNIKIRLVVSYNNKRKDSAVFPITY